MAEERVLFWISPTDADGDKRLEADMSFGDLPRTFRRLRKNLKRRKKSKDDGDMYVDRGGNLCVRLNPTRTTFSAELLFLRLFETRSWRLARGKEFSSKLTTLMNSADDDTLRELRGIFDAIADPDDDVLDDVLRANARDSFPDFDVPSTHDIPDDFWEEDYSQLIT